VLKTLELPDLSHPDYDGNKLPQYNKTKRYLEALLSGPTDKRYWEDDAWDVVTHAPGHRHDLETMRAE